MPWHSARFCRTLMTELWMPLLWSRWTATAARCSTSAVPTPAGLGLLMWPDCLSDTLRGLICLISSGRLLCRSLWPLLSQPWSRAPWIRSAPCLQPSRHPRPSTSGNLPIVRSHGHPLPQWAGQSSTHCIPRASSCLGMLHLRGWPQKPNQLMVSAALETLARSCDIRGWTFQAAVIAAGWAARVRPMALCARDLYLQVSRPLLVLRGSTRRNRRLGLMLMMVRCKHRAFR
mmetsp:Transcript_108770/g.347163  ORF Transcript_108770/g.347163 Transcript_108770/m.347163 type:complete len:231 (+) Transcript_108770:1020-1712(+)